MVIPITFWLANSALKSINETVRAWRSDDGDLSAHTDQGGSSLFGGELNENFERDSADLAIVDNDLIHGLVSDS